MTVKKLMKNSKNLEKRSNNVCFDTEDKGSCWSGLVKMCFFYKKKRLKRLEHV